MLGNNICFYGEIWITILKLSLFIPLLIWSTVVPFFRQTPLLGSLEIAYFSGAINWIFFPIIITITTLYGVLIVI